MKKYGFVFVVLAMIFVTAGCMSARNCRLVAVLTDYGAADFYVGVLEGAMYSVEPRLKISTITHEVDPFNIPEGSYLLAKAAREYPAGTVFVAIVDPGVGTGRRSIVLESADGKIFVAPDNGLLTGVMDELGSNRVFEIRNPGYMRVGAVSSTFHGRDVYGPVAAHIAGGVSPRQVGPRITDPVRLPVKAAKREGNSLAGSIIHVDRYGNLLSNIPGKLLTDLGVKMGDGVRVEIGGRRFAAKLARTYGDVPKNNWLVLSNAEGAVEIARNMASAAREAGAAAGMDIKLLRP